MTYFLLFLVMTALALVPSSSVALVVTRSTTLGVRNGSAVAFGIVLGDLIFVALALFGMSFIAEAMGTFFAIMKYAAGAYLLWIGVGLIRSQSKMVMNGADSRKSTLLASFASGLLLTLGDVKAIFFYASLFPTFIDLSNLSSTSVVAILLITVFSVGGTKLLYAYYAEKIVRRLRVQSSRCLRNFTGALMIGTAGYLIAKT